jgi:hypothetical protein
MKYNQHWAEWVINCLGKIEEICMGRTCMFVHEQQVENKKNGGWSWSKKAWKNSGSFWSIFGLFWS